MLVHLSVASHGASSDAVLALGSFGNRDEILRLLSELPQATVATDAEMLTMINAEQLYLRGIGYVDTQLLASARLTGDRIWTVDKGLHTCARELDIAKL